MLQPNWMPPSLQQQWLEKHLRKETHLLWQRELLSALTWDAIKYRVESPQSLSPPTEDGAGTEKEPVRYFSHFYLVTLTHLVFSSQHTGLTSCRRAQQMLASVTRRPSSGRNKFTNCFFPMNRVCKATISNEHNICIKDKWNNISLQCFSKK